MFAGFCADWENCDLGHLGSRDWQGLFLDSVASSSLVALGDIDSNQRDNIFLIILKTY